MPNRPYGFEIYLVNVKTMRMIAQIFVAFSEKLNFTVWNKLKMLKYTWMVGRMTFPNYYSIFKLQFAICDEFYA